MIISPGFAKTAVLACAVLPGLGSQAAKADDSGDVAELIRLARPNIGDADRWARAVLRALDRHGLERSPENTCAVIAVIDQESGFKANPDVPDLGAMSLKAFRAKVDASAQMQMLFAAFPAVRAKLEKDIARAKTERDLDLAVRKAFDVIRGNWAVGTLISLLDMYQSESAIFEAINKVKTVGAMQVSVFFARTASLDPVREEVADTYALRDRLYTIEGGVEYGTLQLLGYKTPYKQKLHRFADYNAGRYASRNAAFQAVVVKLDGAKLALDGDLLRYRDDGSVAATISRTENAIRRIAAANDLGLKPVDIRRDLELEKEAAFEKTNAYASIRRLYRRRFGADPPQEAMPDIRLDSVKLKSTWTTRRFAESVSGRYRACMRRWRG